MRISTGSARAILAIAGLTVVLTVARSSQASEQVPFVRLREEAGHLKFETCLPAGRGNFEATDPSGLRLSGIVLVTGEGDDRRPRIFRLRAALDGATTGEARTEDAPTPFLIKLQTTPNPDHYELHVELEHFEDGQVVMSHATLGRNCCGYYVTASSAGQKLPVGRGVLLTDVMVAAPATYRQFEQLAELCCRPGFEFVPRSLLSPSIVEQVIAAEEAVPTSEGASQFQHLLDDLDSDAFHTRESAMAQLIRGGRTTLWSLDHLHGAALSAEQRHRIVQVRHALSQYSDPALPFEISGQELRALGETPPQEWLSTLCESTDPRVSNWARQRAAHQTTPADAKACHPQD